mmetsp:Transcript_5987/g.15927  ORF Transcript_5987/g.15927 Transcript_5987/m.15927 type:complete len:593 (+) Transcript_5987:1098-2876(+)|eukprot:CAMPEP_0202374064 /NCGR_PEP_ID=MMETSP1127-20130417/4977_1 /ASSEMBLY_ACC=CAM_ASM_000462 /TAXON_ID=3047 /ORGANISM="Dunaliella tertiolecta, Strain CCMP1320" /LENGTH=592 /DNA_ID=CAMNT_0048971131 /DNA_START=87 /DNA_END=1865 /DNA_ORIENTATION=+
MKGFHFEGKDVAGSFMLLSNAAVLMMVNSLAPENYMDEPFHVPQTQQFCSGNYGVWDPKITTFPGLYVVSAAIMRAYAWLGNHLRMDPSAAYAPCSTASLRAVNTVLWLLCFYVLHAILEQQQQHLQRQHRLQGPNGDEVQQHVAERGTPDQVPDRQRHSYSPIQASPSSPSLRSYLRAPSSPSLWAATLSLFPLHWSYSVLFYTDVGAHLFMLTCLLLSMRQRYGLAAAAGAAAVLFRQTNAVWVAFVLGAAALRIAQDCKVQQRASVPQEQKGVEDGSPNTSSAQQTVQRPCQQSNQHNQQQQQQQEQEQQLDPAGVVGVCSSLKSVWCFRGQILRLLWPLVLVPAAFAAFLVVNKGVAVGDRAAHQPVHHFAQLVYFGLFSAVLLLVPLIAATWLSTLLHIEPNKESLLAPQKRPSPRLHFPFPWLQLGKLAWLALTLIVTALCLAALHSAPSPHPYLLADNRHFTFYVWRRLLAYRSWFHAMILAATAAAAWVSMIRALAAAQQRQHGPLWVCGFVTAAALLLVPAWLLEFRYFTTPLLLLAIHIPRPTCLQAYAVLCFYAAINAVTLYLFLWRPFTWADGSVARFMW